MESEKTYVAVVRDITVIESEIDGIKKQATAVVLNSAIEIGRRLVEAKELLKHGEWGTWIREKCGFSQSTANNMMRLYDEYGAEQFTIFGAVANSQALEKLSYTKAISLLALPADEREGFAEAVHADEISSRELERLVKEKTASDERARRMQEAADEAQREAEESREAAERMRSRAEEAERLCAGFDAERGKLERMIEAERVKATAAEAEAKAAKENAKPSAETLNLLRDQAAENARHEVAETMAELNGKLAAVEKDAAAAAEQRAMLEAKIAEAEARAKQAEEAAEKMRKGQTAADPRVAAFKFRFNEVQKGLKELSDILGELRATDAAVAAKLEAGMRALVQKWGA